MRTPPLQLDLEEGCTTTTTNGNNEWEVSSSSTCSSNSGTLHNTTTTKQVVQRRGKGSKQHTQNSPHGSDCDGGGDKVSLLSHADSSCHEMEPSFAAENTRNNNRSNYSSIWDVASAHQASIRYWAWLLVLSFVISQCIYNTPGVFLEVAFFPARGRMFPDGLKDLILKPTFEYQANTPKEQIMATTKETTRVQIPRIVHLTYKSRQDLSDEWKHSLEQWQVTNPTWEVRFWSDADIAAFVEQEYPHVKPLHDSYKHMIQRVDSVRYMILHHYGGVYSDMDVYPSTSLDKLLRQWEDAGKEVLLAETMNLGVTNAFMAATPQTDFMKCLVDNLPNYQHKFHHIIGWQHWEVLSSAGSTFLWGMVGHCHDDEKVAILPKRAFRGCSVCDAWETGQPTLSCDTQWFRHSSTNSSWHQHKSLAHTLLLNFAMTFLCRPFFSCFVVTLMGLALISRCCQREAPKQLAKNG